MYKMRFIVAMVCFCYFVMPCNSQKQDHTWLFSHGIVDQVDPELKSDTTYGATYISFLTDPPKVRYDSTRVWDFNGTNSCLSSHTGDLQIYTNGQAIYAGDHEVIEDTINYNLQWDNWSLVYEGVLVNTGLPTIQGALILPKPENENLVYVFYSTYDLFISRSNQMSYSVVDISERSILEKDVPLLTDSLLSSGNFNAVQHANGRDWWLVFTGRDHSEIYKYLLTPNGVEFSDLQRIGDNFDSVRGQLYFSSDGSKIAFCSVDNFGEDGGEVYIADFDRITGVVENSVQDQIIGRTFSQGVSFSPNGRFLYATDSDTLYQYDTESENIIESRLNVAIYDGFEYFTPGDTAMNVPLLSRFGWMALGPDGKIYISATSGSSGGFHRINNPNQLGLNCNVAQHSVNTPSLYDRTMPNFPNFRLGPLDDSPADTLGLNNHPVAKYRYVQDSLEDLRVHFFDLSYYDPQDYEWDFGDGNTSDELEPNHTYAEKGVYEVCLTVSNIYDTSTSCKTIMLGTTSTIDRELAVDVSIYPNPTSDYLTISFHNYIALEGMVRFYDVSGQEVMSAELERASNVLSLGYLVSGSYIYKVYDGDDEIYEGRVVVIR